MGLRFRKSIKIAPGVKLNLGKKSTGISIGGKYGGVSLNSKTGARARVSAPGTGMSYSTKIGGSSSGSSGQISTAAPSGINSSGGQQPHKKGSGKKVLVGTVAAILLLCGISSSCRDSGAGDAEDPNAQLGIVDSQEYTDTWANDQETESNVTESDAAEPAQEEPETPGNIQPAEEAADPVETTQKPAKETAEATPEPVTKEKSTETATAPVVVTTPEPAPEPEPKAEATPTPTPAAQEPTGQTVYVTKTGKRYHYDSTCGNGDYSPTTLDKAKSMGLTPCKKCAGG